MWVNKEAGTNDWMDKSARDADHFTEWDMADLRPWKRGFDAFIQYLREDIPASQIQTSSPVCKVFWDSDDAEGSVLVVTSTREAYIADYVVVTTSLGHLKERHASMFDPPLPSEYLDTLNGIELGVTDKILIGWNEPWWGMRPLDLHIIFKDYSLSADESWLYSVMEFASTQRHANVLQAFVTGESAKLMENLPEQEVKNQVVRHLKRVTGQNVPPPSFFRRTQWYNNVWIRGSNSYVTVTGDRNGLYSRQPLTKSVANSNEKQVIFWAGEHTDTERYGTVDGAMSTGEREAFKVLRQYALG
ncbi:spermine oxidase-like [Macrobrachium rosenbergii]|uniref:spermine oxidase-like n=1 Tax=Macrobrachium rosenbergii TaxID=79674 RepID=UPI0034D4AA1D